SRSEGPLGSPIECPGGADRLSLSRVGARNLAGEPRRTRVGDEGPVAWPSYGAGAVGTRSAGSRGPRQGFGSRGGGPARPGVREKPVGRHRSRAHRSEHEAGRWPPRVATASDRSADRKSVV